MEIQQIRRLTLIGIAVIVILVIIAAISTHQSTPSSPLSPTSYTNQISGQTNTFYANKGLETQPLTVTFSGVSALQNQLSGDRYDDALAALKQFVTVQSHYRSHDPVIADVRGGDDSYSFRLFLESSETFYTVNLSFDSQSIPHLSYEVDPDAQI